MINSSIAQQVLNYDALDYQRNRTVDSLNAVLVALAGRALTEQAAGDYRKARRALRLFERASRSVERWVRKTGLGGHTHG